MDSNEIFAVIGRVRRAMPRNADVMALCDAAERLAVARPPLPDLPTAMAVKETRTTTFDKKAYQREYMRKRRRK